MPYKSPPHMRRGHRGGGKKYIFSLRTFAILSVWSVVVGQ